MRTNEKEFVQIGIVRGWQNMWMREMSIIQDDKHVYECPNFKETWTKEDVNEINDNVIQLVAYTGHEKKKNDYVLIRSKIVLPMCFYPKNRGKGTFNDFQRIRRR